MKKKGKALAISVIVMGTGSALLLALLALILGKAGILPRGAAPVLTTVMGCLAVFAGSFSASVYLKEKGILVGLISGILFAMVLGGISYFCFQNTLTVASTGKLAAILISGALGGILGVNRRDKVKF